MLTIYKYTYLLKRGPFTLILPKDAKILDVQIQCHDLVVWAELIPSEPHTTLNAFYVYFTGDEVTGSNVFSHFKTIQSPDGLVWHIYRNI